MKFFYELCPKCKDKLVEQIVGDFQEYTASSCPNCGGEMEFVLLGKKRATDTTYKIILNEINDMGIWKERCIKIIMEISNLDEDEVLKKMNTRNSEIFRGDLLHTYLSLRLLDKIGSLVEYTVKPHFPFGRTISMMCPDCGEDTFWKVDNVGNGYYKSGFYCEQCGEWVMYNVFPQFEIDETNFCVESSLKDTDGEVRKEILKYIKNLNDKIVKGDKVIFRDKARKMEKILSLMEAYNISYKIEPPYPYNIPEWNSKYKNN